MHEKRSDYKILHDGLLKKVAEEREKQKKRRADAEADVGALLGENNKESITHYEHTMDIQKGEVVEDINLKRHERDLKHAQETRDLKIQELAKIKGLWDQEHAKFMGMAELQ